MSLHSSFIITEAKFHGFAIQMQFDVILSTDAVCAYPTTYAVSQPSTHSTLHGFSEETKRRCSALMSHVRTTGESKKQ